LATKSPAYGIAETKDKNPNIVSDIQDIAAEHALDIYTASILYHSKKYCIKIKNLKLLAT
jgi:hypothetical protein